MLMPCLHILHKLLWCCSPVVILGDDWEQIAPVGNYLFDSTVVNLLDDWRLG